LHQADREKLGEKKQFWAVERRAQRPTREHRERAVRCSGKFDTRVERRRLANIL
jgi:hypothetical protein